MGEKKARDCPIAHKVVVCDGFCRVEPDTGDTKFCRRYLRALDLVLNCW